MSVIDLTNQRFGKLVVIKRAPDKICKNGEKLVCWECKCDCGNTKIYTRRDLRSGHVQSCGCLRLEKVREACCKKNIYDLSGEYGIGYTEEGIKFIFDLEDYDLIKNYYWSIEKDGYVFNYSNKILLHRLVMYCPDNKMIDHIHHDKTDNRKSELRICTNQENSMNHEISITNTSGTTGVWWSKRRNKWWAGIYKDGEYIHLGYYEHKDDAIIARKIAEKKYFGEFAIDNENSDISKDSTEYQNYITHQKEKALIPQRLGDIGAYRVYSSDGISLEIGSYFASGGQPLYLLKEENIMNEDKTCNRIGNLSGFSGGSYAGQVYDSEGVAPTITRCGDGGGRMPHVIEKHACAMRGRQHEENGEYIQELEVNGSESSNSITTVQKDSMIMEVGEVYKIRRTTPKECYRLMGMTDEDYEKAAEVNSATQLYKQAGNSICVNVLVAIFGQMFRGHEDDYKKFADDVQY